MSFDIKNIPSKLALTGRIKSWLKNPQDKLPVSCTSITPRDSIEGPDGIDDSLIFTSYGLRNAQGVAINLSSIRAEGTTNSKGLVASGPCSFALEYSLKNQVLRRGGTYKNGAVNLHLDYRHPDAIKFVLMTREELPWAYRTLDVDDYFISYLSNIVINKTVTRNYINPQTNQLETVTAFYKTALDAVIAVIKAGDLFLSKIIYDKNGLQLNSNVCLEVYFRSRATCLLAHVNLGECKPNEIPTVMKNGMIYLSELHNHTNVGNDGKYLNAQEDRQVGLGVIGLANLLANEDVKYLDFVRALELVTGLDKTQTATPKAIEIASNIYAGYIEAAKIAKSYNMDRAFCVDKNTWITTQNGPRQVKDLVGTQFTAIVNGQPYLSTEQGFFSSGTKDLYTYKFAGGYQINCTEDHKLLTESGWKEAGQLTTNDNVLLNIQKGNTWNGQGSFEEGWLLGNLLGDGCIHSRQADNRNNYARLQYWGVDKEIMLAKAIEMLKLLNYIDDKQSYGYLNAEHDTAYIRSTKLACLASEFGLDTYPNKVITSAIEQASSEFTCGFIKGLFDADGTVNLGSSSGSGRKLSLSQMNPETLYAVQRMLLRLGIKSSVYKNKSTYSHKLKSTGETITQNSNLHNLVIQSDSIILYADLIGFSQPAKLEKLNTLLNSYKRGIMPTKYLVAFVESEYKGEEDVYDCTIDTVHEFDGNGLRVHNCIAPTATCSYKYTDRFGYTTTPEIAPPINRAVERDSDTFGTQIYYYPDNVEIAEEVGYETFFRLNNVWQYMMNLTDLAHSISTNWWADIVTMDVEFLQKWLDSYHRSLYYSLNVKAGNLDKSNVITLESLEDLNCSINNREICIPCGE